MKFHRITLNFVSGKRPLLLWIRVIIVTFGVVAALLQFGLLLSFTYNFIITIGMAGDSMTAQQFDALTFLPLGTLVGAALAGWFMPLGGAVMLATAFGYYYFGLSGFGLVVYASAMPGAVSFVVGLILWYRNLPAR